MGRIAIFELMIITETMRELITRDVTNRKLGKAAIDEGMKILKEDGLNKVLEGVTTIDEVLRVSS